MSIKGKCMKIKKLLQFKSLKKLLLNTSNYLIVAIVGALFNVIMMKYYTNIFTKNEYGVMSFYLSFFYFIIPFIALGVDSSFERLYYDYKDDERTKEKYIGSVKVLMLSINVVIVIILSASAFWINQYFSGSYIVYFAVVLAAVACSWENFYTKINVVEQNVKIFSLAKMAYYLIGNVTSIAIISFVSKGVEARFIGLIFGYAVSAGIAVHFSKTSYNKSIKINNYDRKMMHELIVYSLPMLLTVILTTSFSYVDKLFIRVYYDFANIAEYSVGQNIGKILSLLIEAATMAITPMIIKSLNENYDLAIKKLKRINLIYVLSLVIVGLCIILFRKPIIFILASKEYKEASAVFIFMVMTYIVAGAYKIPSIVLMYHKKVNILPVLGTVNLITNITFNWIFVKKYGINGVAFASYLSMLVYSFLNYLFVSNYMYTKKNLIILFGMVGIFSVLGFVY